MRTDIQFECKNALDQILESYQEYVETHQDSGDNYAHLVFEGSWAYTNADSRLREFIVLNNIETYELDHNQIAQIVLDHFEMCPDHIFRSNRDQVFVVDSFAIQEIEHQIDYSVLQEMVGLRLTKARAQVLFADYCAHYHNNSMLIYTPSDTLWSAEITANELQELIKDYADIAA